MKLGYLQVDQAHPHRLACPVVVTPNQFKAYTRDQSPLSIFNSIIVLDKRFKKNIFVREISVDLGDVVTFFAADFIELGYNAYKEVEQIMNAKQDAYLVLP